jgi:hypothetical protein
MAALPEGEANPQTTQRCPQVSREGAGRRVVVAHNRVTRPHRGVHLDGRSDGSHNENQRDHHHHLEKGKALGVVSVFGVLPRYEAAD